ncbi:GNAT family N-acetyltransferase, partial [Ideonella sp.]|uniref:GNAT family N-acetyltransferase n=1 Tax=Ideonella sp. TaxID=1929293 RepID=UPI003BB7248B
MLQPATALTIRPIHPDEVEAVRRLLADHGWTSKVADPATFQELLRRSQVALVAVQDGEVVGFIRGLTDGIFNGYLSMVVVARAHQGQGIGTALMRQAMGSNPEITWV